MPDPARQQRLAKNLATLRAGLDNRYVGYTILTEIAADCRALRLCVTDVLTVVVPAQPVAHESPAVAHVCDQCGKSFPTQMALFGHKRVHKPSH
ncbi:C2H2-type zinc finger protein [Fibrella aestuarina]|uniref:C2H2-type zinc finger protein n=1 Tax=Fibrella aestuarina TaxID=651143 RepID=UPI00130D9010|nr:C2H2-type zinc finger protein [Fibrella aestuarina]